LPIPLLIRRVRRRGQSVDVCMMPAVPCKSQYSNNYCAKSKEVTFKQTQPFASA